MMRLAWFALFALAVYGMVEPVAAANLVVDGIDWLRAWAGIS